MPPKKGGAKAKKAKAGEKRTHDETEDKPEVEDKEVKDVPDKHDDEDNEETDTKDEAEGGLRSTLLRADSEPPAKTSKTSSSALDWLLSDEAFNMANPELPPGHGEIDWDSGRKAPPAESAGKHTSKNGKDEQPSTLRYPHSQLTPFQNLVSASILSKPLSHKLGLRTIQTLLNEPFGLRTLSDLDEAGYEGRRKVMWEARTQHKEKTASQLGDLCEGIKELCGNDEGDQSELKGVREMIKSIESPQEAQEKVVEVLTKIKGIGPGGAAIFLRRVQADWDEVYPFADDRSLSAAREFGLIKADEGAEELAKVTEDRGQYVRLLDTLVGIELEKKVDEAKKAAGM